MKDNATDVINQCKNLRRYWAPRNEKMKEWYKLIQQVDELKTEKMESFVGNDPRSMFNLVLHLLDSPIPHRIKVYDMGDFELATAVGQVSDFLEDAWQHSEDRFRKSGPRQSMKRSLIGLLLATGWYSVFSIVSDDGLETYADVWHPMQTFPYWSDGELSEVAHIFDVSPSVAARMCQRNGWKFDRRFTTDITIYDYWWIDWTELGSFICNAVVMGTKLVKFEPTRFNKIRVYVAPVGGLPDTGPLSEGSELSTSSYNAGAQVKGERWKEEIGQSIVATNENIYRSWNKWWTYSLQLLRDTAQPRIFERSRSGKAIVRPEDVFKRGAIWRGGPEDSVDFVVPPPMPLELRSTQLDLEAMMQRGGVSWAMHGSVTQQMTAYVMTQIAASANQIMKPFHQAIQNLYSDIDNDWINDIRDRGVSPYGFKLPAKVTKDLRVSAEYEVEIPGELIQKATVARMLDPDFRLSYSYTLQKLFPEIKNPMEERARIRSDIAEQHPVNATVALIMYYRKMAAYLESVNDSESARLYELAAGAAEATLAPEEREAPRREIGGRPEALPPVPLEATNVIRS